MNVSPDWFRVWFDSPYYHKLYFERDEQEASAFINRLLFLLHPRSGSRMLDLACGRGRHSRMLASKGFDVTGIDLSANSIEYARRWENEHLHFYVHDMRQILYTNYFDDVFNFFTSFGYFRTGREHHNVLRTVSTSLKAGGRFVLDYLNVRYAEDHLVHRSKKEMDGVSYDLTKWSDKDYFYKKIHITDPQLEAPLEYIEKVAKFTREDFDAMFASHGMQLQDLFGNYQLDPYDAQHSTRMVMIAQKK